MARSGWWCVPLVTLLACATSPDSPDPGVLKLYVAADVSRLSPAGGDTFLLRFWNERAYRDDGMWADVFDSLAGAMANRNTGTDTVEVFSATATPPGTRIAFSHVPPASYDSLTLSVDHVGYIVLDGVRIPVTSAIEERRTVLPYRFHIDERDTVELMLTCYVDSSLERHGDELKFLPVMSVEEVVP